MGEYRIDELARLAATTVRNVRVYQDRGLLAPPRRDGRVGIYTDAHLARLRLIGRLLSRGYTFANIGEMLAVWERGGTLAEILDLESAVAGPWSDEVPGYVTAEQLGVLFGAGNTAENRARAADLGILEPDGARYLVPSPRLLGAGAELVTAGMTLPDVLDLAERLRAQVDAVAHDMAATVAGHVVAAHLRGRRAARRGHRRGSGHRPAAAAAGPDRARRHVRPGDVPACPRGPGRSLPRADRLSGATRDRAAGPNAGPRRVVLFICAARC